jgi:hypothetical protein
MTFQNTASQLAARGRNGDSTLVHMSRGELKSLQDLALAGGGSLSINPDTGLPEASFLKRLLPTIIGAGLSMIPGVGPLMAAGIVGGGTALATGDLNKGLMAGLGAYGGAGLAGGLTSAGSAATASTSPLDVLGQPMTTAAQTGAQTAGQNLAQAGQGLSSLGSEAGRQAFMGGVGGGAGLAKYGLAAASPFVMGQERDKPTPTQPMNRLEYEARPVTPTPMADVPGYDDLGRDFGRQQRYFDPRYVDTGRKFTPGDFAAKTTTPMPLANGGMPNLAAVGDNNTYPLSGVPNAQYKPNLQDPQQANVLRNTPVPEVDPFTGEERFASGGLSHLGGYSDGGRMLRGPGDGVSDSIPATIGDKQPARLADGEFVVPARIVSEIGNGSSEAGARKLYAMMDRVQNSRKKSVGKGKVAVDSKAEKHLPA